MMQHQLVKIMWKDAFAGPHGWLSLDDYEPEPALPITIGWLLPNLLDGYISTADTYLVQDDEVTYYNVGHIPLEMVQQIEVLEIEEEQPTSKRKKGGK